MKKSKAVIILLVIVLLIGGLGYTTAFGIGEEKVGAAEGIKLGLDLAGGVSITYQVTGDEEPSIEDMNDTVYKLQIQNLWCLTEIPVICLLSGKSCTMYTGLLSGTDTDCLSVLYIAYRI